MQQLQDFINQHIQKIEPLETQNRLAWWKLATTGDEAYAEEYRATTIALKAIYSSKEDYIFLQTYQHKEHTPLLDRQVQLLLNKYIENQVSPSLLEEIVKLESTIEEVYTTFRAKLKERSLSNNELKEILTHSLDSNERREAWEASKMIGKEVEQNVLKLIEQRNHCAQQVRFTNYYTMRLKLQELEEEKLFNLLDQIEALTTPLWQVYKTQLDEGLAKKYGISSKELMPWHYQDPFFQEAPQQEFDFDRFYKGRDVAEISRHFYEQVGLPVEDILGRSDLYEREKKNQHAFCNCIDQKQDVRILCNLRDNEYWMGTQLHELGHAVYDKYIDAALPYLLRQPAHTMTTEAIAMLFGRLSKNREFLMTYCEIPSNVVQDVDRYSRLQSASHLLVFTRWTLVMIHFERAMYQEPRQNLNQLWWDLVKRFQWVNPVPGRDQPDWAAKLHLACAPVYYQNYLLGELTASQLAFYLGQVLKKHGESFCHSERVGEWLKGHLFYLGASLAWNQTLYQATGELLNPKYFINDITLGG